MILQPLFTIFGLNIFAQKLEDSKIVYERSKIRSFFSYLLNISMQCFNIYIAIDILDHYVMQFRELKHETIGKLLVIFDYIWWISLNIGQLLLIHCHTKTLLKFLNEYEEFKNDRIQKKLQQNEKKTRLFAVCTLLFPIVMIPMTIEERNPVASYVLWIPFLVGELFEWSLVQSVKFHISQSHISLTDLRKSIDSYEKLCKMVKWLKVTFSVSKVIQLMFIMFLMAFYWFYIFDGVIAFGASIVWQVMLLIIFHVCLEWNQLGEEVSGNVIYKCNLMMTLNFDSHQLNVENNQKNMI